MVRSSVAPGGAGDVLVKVWYCMLKVGAVEIPNHIENGFSVLCLKLRECFIKFTQCNVCAHLRWDIDSADNNRCKIGAVVTAAYSTDVILELSPLNTTFK